MANEVVMTGRLLAAARTLVGLGRARLASLAEVDVRVLEGMEAAGSAPVPSSAPLVAICRALEETGAVFLAEADGEGAGVRLKFSRGQARAIDRWESEGGNAADDDIL
jgi:hypothetical protein